METKLHSAAAWDFEKCLQVHGIDIREKGKGKDVQPTCIKCKVCNKKIKLRGEYCAGHFVDHYNGQHKNNNIQNQGSMLTFLKPMNSIHATSASSSTSAASSDINPDDSNEEPPRKKNKACDCLLKFKEISNTLKKDLLLFIKYGTTHDSQYETRLLGSRVQIYSKKCDDNRVMGSQCKHCHDLCKTSKTKIVQRLRRKHQKYREVLDDMNTPIITVSQIGRLQKFRKASSKFVTNDGKHLLELVDARIEYYNNSKAFMTGPYEQVPSVDNLLHSENGGG